MKEVGLAIMDLRRPELLLTQFTDSKSYSFTTSKLVRSTSLLRTEHCSPGLSSTGHLRSSGGLRSF